ncbi:MAG: hypothetical protein Kow0092_35430 [Deferrisomatales bacterium]
MGSTEIPQEPGNGSTEGRLDAKKLSTHGCKAVREGGAAKAAQIERMLRTPAGGAMASSRRPARLEPRLRRHAVDDPGPRG